MNPFILSHLPPYQLHLLLRALCVMLVFDSMLDLMLGSHSLLLASLRLRIGVHALALQVELMIA